MKKYIELLRVKHYIKNALIFVPMFFGGLIFDENKMSDGLLGFIAFCMISSAIYVLNDLRDIEKDRKHPTKRYRPLASGKVKPQQGVMVMIGCLFLACIISILIKNIYAAMLLGMYFVLNVAYSMGLKNKPIIDIVILASGFVIRIF